MPPTINLSVSPVGVFVYKRNCILQKEKKKNLNDAGRSDVYAEKVQFLFIKSNCFCFIPAGNNLNFFITRFRGIHKLTRQRTFSRACMLSIRFGAIQELRHAILQQTCPLPSLSHTVTFGRPLQ